MLFRYYKDTDKILGQTFSMLVLQDFEAITPNLLARTIETVEGGGIVVCLLQGMKSLRGLYSMTMVSRTSYHFSPTNDRAGQQSCGDDPTTRQRSLDRNGGQQLDLHPILLSVPSFLPPAQSSSKTESNVSPTHDPPRSFSRPLNRLLHVHSTIGPIPLR